MSKWSRRPDIVTMIAMVCSTNCHLLPFFTRQTLALLVIKTVGNGQPKLAYATKRIQFPTTAGGWRRGRGWKKGRGWQREGVWGLRELQGFGKGPESPKLRSCCGHYNGTSNLALSSDFKLDFLKIPCTTVSVVKINLRPGFLHRSKGNLWAWAWAT